MSVPEWKRRHLEEQEKRLKEAKEQEALEAAKKAEEKAVKETGFFTSII